MRNVALLLVIGLAATAAAEVVGVGSTLAARTLEDQHGQPRVLDGSVRVVVFARDMEAGDRVEEALEDSTGEELQERGVAYLADISGMPKLVARLFALPAMRRRAYPMWLDRDGAATADLPAEPGKVTILRLQALRVTEVSFLDSAEAVRAALAPAP